ncbi:hypothetical protein [Asticcacaulis sp. YBE204]|uniref:hypothetical protein n=1 Tax=Asticcacaulis sp. YBE204 TaxID=1282363 RepID=UPI0003C3B977|nr:hypothetical protein [Asticcacaulis sp. YBE204]ESQ77890.1 hypothetical protein AEYBE204_16560 [Asticcacaulis sp. YBE204]
MFTKVSAYAKGFSDGFFKKTPHAKILKEDKAAQDNISETEIDKAVDQSFPASDASAKY